MKTILFKALFFPFRVRPGVKPPERVDRVLVIRQDNRIGNLILITPLLALIKERWPKCELDVVVGGFFGSVIANNPAIDHLLIYDQLKFIRMPWRFFAFLFSLRSAKYDVVFDLKSAFSFNNMMLAVASGGAYRVGFKNALSTRFFHREIALEPPNHYEAHRLLALLTPFMLSTRTPAIQYMPAASSVKTAREKLAASGFESVRPVGVHTGGRGQKKLSIVSFMQLGDRLRQEHIPVVFFFGPDEVDERLYFEKAGFCCFSPRRIADFGGFLPHLRLFVSCDTGPMHMAAGAGVPTVSFFLASSPACYGPQGEGHYSYVLTPEGDIIGPVLKAVGEMGNG